LGEKLVLKFKDKSKKVILLMIVILFLAGSFAPLIQGLDTGVYQGFDKGPSYTSVVPMKKVTFVNFDEDSYIDDYAYLASIPTAIFNEQNKLFSHPLLFYQDKLEYNDDKYRSLDAYTGIYYFMQDYMSYCNGKLDQMTLINLGAEKITPEWRADEIVEITGEDIYEIASKIALSDWSYSDNAVIAVSQETFDNLDLQEKHNEIKKQLPANKIKKLETFNVEQTNRLNPVSAFFEVDEKYCFIEAEAWWDGMLVAGTMLPTGDPDIQLYCKKDDKWMQTVATAAWNIYYPAGHEITKSYVYSPGDWRVTITDFPTESDAPRSGIPNLFQLQGSLFNFFKPVVNYHVDITLFPGITFELPDAPPFGCRDAEFKLSWNNPDVVLGFTLIGPGGEAIYTEINESKTKNQEMTIDFLGECLPDESYKVSVFSLNDVTIPVDFTLEYSFKQEIPEKKADSLASASNGAVLASNLNAPLLYTKADSLSECTSNALYTLGVKNIYIVDINKNLNKEIFDELTKIAKIEKNYLKLEDIYTDILNDTGSNSIVFTTIDPWTKWYVAELKPGDETDAGLFLGPAAYIAAHHGTPVLIIDNHPELSSAAVWHNEFWRRYSAERYNYKPSVAEMSLTGARVYDFLGKYGFDKPGDETIVTVADQYDIGVSWDRVFVGVANSGRFCGTPVDTAVSISRSMFYPALIFENPALKGSVNLINGSKSERGGLLGLFQKPYLNTLVVKEGGEEKYDFPVLCSFVTHKHRFNERASAYYETKYECADGRVPGETASMQHIDQGVNEKYTGDAGMYFPDMTETEIVPFYLNKGGFDTAFSTNLQAVQNNLNQGVLLWIHASHGTQQEGGRTLFWDVDTGFGENHKLAGILAGAKYEVNPWRGYDWYLGSTQEPDTMTMDIKGMMPFTNHNSLIIPATGMDWVLARKPIREKLNQVIPFIDPFDTDNLYDGLIGTVSFSRYPLVDKNALQIEEGLENIYSVGFVTSICQTSNTYLHLMMIRHGSVFQVQDPWPTSWYGAIWRQSIPRDIILGYTVGEAYTRGMSTVGNLYLGGGKDGPQWWWDDAQNVVYFGDPNLRMYVPSTEYSDNNYWEKDETRPIKYDAELSINGHMPFGATSYPYAREKPALFFGMPLFIVVILVLVVILVMAILLFGKKK
jgi:hypothetical protein